MNFDNYTCDGQMSIDDFVETKPGKKQGYEVVSRIIGAHNVSAEDRAENDFYATDPEAAEWLIKIEKLNQRIWEPACGMGHLSKVFVDHGYTVLSTDLVDRGYGIAGVDFLKTNDMWKGDIETNPPYKLEEEFIKHALDHVLDRAKVCMFLKIQFLEGKARKKLYEEMPPKTVWVSSSRIKCGNNGQFSSSSSMMALAWYVWEKGYKGDTTIKWFN